MRLLWKAILLPFGDQEGEESKAAFLVRRTGLEPLDDDGTDQSPLTENAVFDYEPVWSPAGTQIAFTSLQAVGSFEIFKMDANGDNPTNLTNNAASDQQPDWQPMP